MDKFYFVTRSSNALLNYAMVVNIATQICILVTFKLKKKKTRSPVSQSYRASLQHILLASLGECLCRSVAKANL